MPHTASPGIVTMLGVFTDTPRNQRLSVSKPVAVITETLDTTCADWLAQHAQVVWQSHEDAVPFADVLATADALIVRTYTQVTQQLLDQAPKLKVIARAGVGLDNIDLPACQARNIPVVYTPDANTQAVVEYVIALMLDVERPRGLLAPHDSPERFHELRKTQVGRHLADLTLGILGFGRIGSKLGRVAHAMGMELLVCDLLPEPQLRGKVDYPFEYVDHETLYRQSDIVTVHVDGRPANRHMIGSDQLAMLRDDVTLINAARGMLIDDHALARWAGEHPQAHVLLDVHDPEPPGEDNPLWPIENVTLLPHLASRTSRAMENMSWVVRDVVKVLRGKAPQYPAT